MLNLALAFSSFPIWGRYWRCVSQISLQRRDCPAGDGSQQTASAVSSFRYLLTQGQCFQSSPHQWLNEVGGRNTRPSHFHLMQGKSVKQYFLQSSPPDRPRHFQSASQFDFFLCPIHFFPFLARVLVLNKHPDFVSASALEESNSWHSVSEGTHSYDFNYDAPSCGSVSQRCVYGSFAWILSCSEYLSIWRSDCFPDRIKVIFLVIHPTNISWLLTMFQAQCHWTYNDEPNMHKSLPSWRAFCRGRQIISKINK